MFNEAIHQLIQWGGVYINESSESVSFCLYVIILTCELNSSGLRYVAHKTPEMTWDCVIAVKSGELWVSWRTTVLGKHD
jgi:hypothetical protein